jgi:hypothetical protein
MKKAIKILTLLLALALVISAFAVMVFATDDCEGEERNVAPLATASGNSARWSESYFRPFINDGDRMTGSPANYLDRADNYDTILTFDKPYKFTKMVLVTYSEGRIEAEYSINNWVSGKTSNYDINVYLYDYEGTAIFQATVSAGGTKDIVIEIEDDIGYACSAGVFYTRTGEAQCIWEFELYTKDNHNWQDVAGTDTSTCTLGGTKTMQCATCLEEARVATPARGHTTCGDCEIQGCADGTAPDHTCETTCPVCNGKVAPAHTKNPDIPCDPDCYICDAKDVFEVTHKADTSKPCSTDCYYCGKKNVATANHVANALDMCDNDCAVCGAEDVIPTMYELAKQGANLDSAYTNPNKYITHVANPSNPCDTTCANPNCETRQSGYTGATEVVVAEHQGTACGQTYCPSCNEPFYGYKNNTFHVRNDGTVSGKNICSRDCANGHASSMYWAHEYATCTDLTSKCSICNGGAPTAERRHTFTKESPFACVGENCTYQGGSAACIEHVYTNRCDQKCNVCGAQGQKSFFGSRNLVPELWHCYQSTCDTTCEDCGAERIITHAYPSAECGEYCKVCDKKRETAVAHTYSDLLDEDLNLIEYSSACDTVCDACGETREVPHRFLAKCSAKCLICYLANPNIEHTYTDDCDEECDIVGCIGTRTAPHNFKYACVDKCSDCDAENPSVVDHIYGATCDTTCNRGCGFVRTGVKHTYDNVHDATCNIEGCGFVRTAETDSTFVAACVYDNACDATCNACGAQRTPADHAYDNACDTTCNVCNTTRTVAAHVYGEDFEESAEGTKIYTCTICGAKSDSGEKAGLGGGAIAGIVAGSTVVAGGGGFAAWWFIFKKKRI